MKAALRRVLTSKYFLIPLAALLLYTLTGFIIAPFAVRWYTPRYALDRYKLQASMGKVRLNPFIFTFEINGFSLTESDGTPLVGFEKLFLDFEMSGLVHWTVKFRELLLDKPALNVVLQRDGGLNLAKFAARSNGPKEAPSEPLRMIFERVAITSGQVDFTDRRLSKPASLRFHDLNLNFKDLSTLQNRNGTYSFLATTAGDETIQWQGEFSLIPFRSKGNLAFKNIQAATLWNFQRDAVNLKPPAGKMDVSTDYNLDASAAPLQLTLDNLRVDLSKLSLQLADADKPLVELNKMEVASARLDFTARTLHIGRLLWDGGMLRLGVDEAGQINLEKIVSRGPKQERKEEKKQQKPVEAASSPSGHSPWAVNVDAIELKDIGLAYDDLSRALPLTVNVSRVAIRAKAKIQASAPKAQVSLQEITTELKQVQVGSSQGPEPLFRTEKLITEGGDLDLGARKVTVSRIALSNGTVDLSREQDGRINWMQLFAPKGGVPESSESKPGAGLDPPWKFLFKAVEYSGFRYVLSDHTVAPDKALLNLEALNMRFTDVDGASPMGFHVDFQVKEGGAVTLNGTVDPKGQSVEATCKVSGLALTPAEPYLEPYITLSLQSAALSSDGVFRYGTPAKGAKLSYEGSFTIDKFSLTKPGSKETYLGWGRMHVPQLKLTLQPNRVQIGEVRLSKPVCELIIAEDRTVNLAKLLKKKAGQKEPPPAPKAKPPDGGDSFPFSIGKIRIEQGRMRFADLSLFPQFMTRIHTMKGTISRISSAKDSSVQIQLDGRVDQYGSAKITGALNAYDPARSTDISMVFRNVEMTNLTPYSGKFAGRRIKSGKLSMDLKYKIQNSKLIGDNKIIVDNLLLGERVDSPDATNLPLDLAIALLKDSNGRIDIGLPVSGDLSNPQFRLGPLIWKALVNLLTKAVTSPFRALGALFGGETEKFEAVAFDPGSAELLPPEKEKLKKLADALQKRPELKLVVQGRYSTEADGITFKELGVRRAVAFRLGSEASPGEDAEPLDFNDSKTRRALEEIYQERFGAPALDEIEQALEQGTIKPRATPKQEDQGERKKPGLFSRVAKRIKIYKIVPGAKSPEESELMAGELYARLVEKEPVSEKTLSQLAQERAQAVIAELQSAGGVPEQRLDVQAPETVPAGAEPSASLSLDALAEAP